MGCDIHPVILVRQEIGGWEPRIIPDDDRSYLFFGSLAGVRRDDVEPIFPARGWPPFISGYIVSELAEYFIDGDHSSSWFTLKEAKDYHSRIEDPTLREMWASWIQDMQYAKKFLDYPATDDDVIVVFNFDN